MDQGKGGSSGVWIVEVARETREILVKGKLADGMNETQGITCI